MRKRGIAGIKDRNKIKEKTAEKAQELQKADLEHVEKQFSLFKERLEHFAKNHRSEIRKNPAFRKQFQVFFLKKKIETSTFDFRPCALRSE